MPACLVFFGWSVLQLDNIAAHGIVFSGPHHNIRRITLAQEPFWFAMGIAVYSLLLVMVAAYTFSVLRRAHPLTRPPVRRPAFMVFSPHG